jgi:membrane-associated protease RseP (regulator of RpoE activity)
MAYAIGVILFALAILASVCLHEAGHMVTAKAFGMKVTKYSIGFGRMFVSFRRGETTYGIGPLPLGGYVKIVGMTPLEDDVEPGEEHRAFWRQPLWQRTIVLSAGSLTHFVLGFVLLWVAASFVGVPNPAAADFEPRSVIGTVSECVTVVDPAGLDRGGCSGDQVSSPAFKAGLRKGDAITAVAGKPVSSYRDLVAAIRALPAGPSEVEYVRGGVAMTAKVDLVISLRPPIDAPDSAATERVATLGITGETFGGPVTVTYGPIEGTAKATGLTGELFRGTFGAIGSFPQKIPPLIDALFGGQRGADTPVSVVGASRIGGEVVAQATPEAPTIFLLLLASLNVFIGIFNLFPLLPLDGGHIAIAWFERVRSWWATRRGRPDPGRIDYNKLMPLTYAVVLVFGTITLLTVATDIVNPIRLFQ